MAKNKRKKPFWKENPSINKTPRKIQDPESTETQTIVWHLSIIDKEGQWGWENAHSLILWSNIFQKIRLNLYFLH